jgi:SAM-dependent methyltransferase
MKSNTITQTDPAGVFTLITIGRASRFNEWMYDTIHPYLKGEILELGTGMANISNFAIRDELSITLSDVDASYREFLNEKFAAFPNVKGILRIDLQHPSFATEYSSLEGKFDTVFLLNVIEHLKDDQAAIANCHFLLKKGGNLIVLAPAWPSLYCRFDKELGHYRRYTAKSLSTIFPPSQFTRLHKQYFNAAGIAGWFLFGKLLKRKLIGSEEMSVFNRFVPLFKLIDRISLKKLGLSAIFIAQKK